MKRTHVDWMCDECSSDYQTKASIKLPITVDGKAARLDFCNKKCRDDFATNHKDEGN